VKPLIVFTASYNSNATSNKREAVSVFFNNIVKTIIKTYIPLYPGLTNYYFDCKFTVVFTKIPSSLLLSIFEHLRGLSVNIHATDFKLDVMFCCGFVVDSVVYPSLSTTDTAKHNLGRSGRHSSTNQLHTHLLPVS
jgi:hypothetical protein